MFYYFFVITVSINRSLSMLMNNKEHIIFSMFVHNSIHLMIFKERK